VEFIDALGAVGVTMPNSDLYTALQQKLVEATVAVSNNFAEGSMWEVCKYRIDHTLWGTNMAGLINLDKWKSLSPAQQKALSDAGAAVEPDEYNYCVDATKKYLQTFTEKGMKTITFSPDDAKWFVDLDFEARWGAAKKVMTADDYAKAYKIYGQGK
jgi:TRAP-type C4-dicarboxylate transport system substrate-binding protein